jgi:hypothetical protein
MTVIRDSITITTVKSCKNHKKKIPMANLLSWDAPGVKTDTNFINSANSTKPFSLKS